MLNLKPFFDAKYPPFLNGKYFDDYFSNYWSKQSFKGKDDVLFLDIFWCNVFHTNGGPNNVPELREYVHNACKNAEDKKRFVFTICQWDDNICMTKPSNLIVYSMGTTNDVTLPLIVEDKTSRLENISKLSYNERDILCSFVGTNTHGVRGIIYRELHNNPNFVFYMKNSWDIHVNEQLVELFINITKRSKFALAPRGYGPSSFRFFEIIQMGVIPIYVYDDVNALPFLDIIDYSKFSIVLHINDIMKLPKILSDISEDQYHNMLSEMQKIKYWFTMEGTCEYIKQDIIKRLQ